MFLFLLSPHRTSKHIMCFWDGITDRPKMLPLEHPEKKQCREHCLLLREPYILIKLELNTSLKQQICAACVCLRVCVYFCACVCGFGLVVDLHDSNFKRQRYQIQTWAALLGLTNEELLCERRRNLQHPPFIYTGGLVRTCACVRNHACVCVCAFLAEEGALYVLYVRTVVLCFSPPTPPNM